MNLVKILTPDFKGTQMDRIKQALPQIFDFDFPIWNESERQKLELKIISHYYIHEIGFETVELWKFKLNERLNLIMPYYNQMAKTYNLDYDFMSDIETTETILEDTTLDRTGTTTGDQNVSRETINKETGEGNSTDQTLNSDFPQANYNNVDYGTTLDESEGTNEYTRNTNIDETQDLKTESEFTENNKTNRAHTRTNEGRNRPIAELIQIQRKAIINLESQIINDLSDLFMQIYSY